MVFCVVSPNTHTTKQHSPEAPGGHATPPGPRGKRHDPAEGHLSKWQCGMVSGSVPCVRPAQRGAERAPGAPRPQPSRVPCVCSVLRVPSSRVPCTGPYRVLRLAQRPTPAPTMCAMQKKRRRGLKKALVSVSRALRVPRVCLGGGSCRAGRAVWRVTANERSMPE
jgi:hypothetical protein